METVSKVICVWPIVTVARDQLLWAKINITLETVSMVTIDMDQNMNCLVSMATVAMKQIHSNQSLATIAVVLLSNQMESVMKVWV